MGRSLACLRGPCHTNPGLALTLVSESYILIEKLTERFGLHFLGAGHLAKGKGLRAMKGSHRVGSRDVGSLMGENLSHQNGIPPRSQE